MDTALATIDLIQLSDDELAETYVRACRRRDQEEFFIARIAAEFAKRRKFDDDGFVSPIDWMRFNGHVTSGAAANSVAVGEAIDRMPESVNAMAEGEIGFAHLTVMARTAEALGERFDESVLIKKARENSPGKFHYICTHYRHAADPKQYADEQAEQVQQRRLKLSRWMDGTVLLSGQLDPEGGAVLLTAIGPLARKTWSSAKQMHWSSSPQVAGRKHRSRSPAPSRHWSGWRAHQRRTWSSPCRFRPGRSSGWRATAASPASCSAPTRW
jgi:hypothetical protein